MIAFHYPPAKGSSGIQRTLSFSRYLKENGWQPVVLSAARRAYPQSSDDQLSDIPDFVTVKRAFALDSAKHLSIQGKYLPPFAYPDRWITWWLGAIWPALRLVRRHRPSVIWSTYPIATAHLIGLTVHRITGIPWIADFRDLMTEDNYPPDKYRRRVCRWIERHAVSNAAISVLTAPGAVDIYADRYPSVDASRLRCILNGYDEDKFRSSTTPGSVTSDGSDKHVLLHSGILYPSERDPTAFFSALAQLKEENFDSLSRFEIRLRASGHDDILRQQIHEHGIENYVKLLPALGYSDALEEMMKVDGLLIFQASNCNHQIPAKMYEYLRAGRPILALTDPLGDTAKILGSVGVSSILRLDSQADIVRGLKQFLPQVVSGSAHIVSEQDVSQFSRRSQTKELAELFDEVSK
jgi:glycosyltransferase involved in cell wall biosynthesis